MNLTVKIYDYNIAKIGGIFINNVVLAFLLTAVAGLSTGIGSLIAFIAKKQTQNSYLLFWAYRQEL